MPLRLVLTDGELRRKDGHDRNELRLHERGLELSVSDELQRRFGRGRVTVAHPLRDARTGFLAKERPSL
jgi:hypothetical protein